MIFFFFYQDIALYVNDSADFDATVQVPNVYCTIYDCLNETNVYQTLNGLKQDSNPSEEQCDTYEIIANCVREKTVRSTKALPPIPTNSEKKHLPTPSDPTRDTPVVKVVDVSKGSDLSPKLPPRSNKTITEKFKRQISTSEFVTKECDVIGELQSNQNEESASCSASGVTAPKLPARSGDRQSKSVQSSAKQSNISGDHVKQNVNEMCIEDVCNVLQKLGLEKYIPVFQKQWIDGAILNELNADILHTECGMKKIEAVRLMSYVKKGHIPR
jgi:hypothetical protein